jgi:hypothetical protein
MLICSITGVIRCRTAAASLVRALDPLEPASPDPSGYA